MSSHKHYRLLRKQLAEIPPDELRRYDTFRLRALALDALAVCEYLAAQHSGSETDVFPELCELLSLRLEDFP